MEMRAHALIRGDSTERGPGAAGCEAGARPPLMRRAFARHDSPAGGTHRRPRAEMIRLSGGELMNEAEASSGSPHDRFTWVARLAGDLGAAAAAPRRAQEPPSGAPPPRRARRSIDVIGTPHGYPVPLPLRNPPVDPSKHPSRHESDPPLAAGANS